MKVSAAALAVILIATALCAPASASPFVTRKNRQVCANPEKKWVREYINSLEMS
uniref:Chemokine interleukin-8-like domain-containing protein n=1 Tax=Gorilla gorilla gorilla TaxID=9595 RepID=G3QXA0_GORGO